MSVREFFSTRFTFPGYTFLLFSILLLFPQIEPIIRSQNEYIGVIFGFIFIFSGAPLGFFIAQVWYLYFFDIKRGNMYRGFKCEPWFLRGRPRKYIKYIKNIVIDEKYRIKNSNSILIYVSDYLCHSSKNDGLKEYTARRWDLINMMGATVFSIIIALITGLFIKSVFYDIDIYAVILNSCISLELLIIFIGLLFVIFFTWGRNRIEDEYDELVTMMVKKCYEENEDIRRSFYLFDEKYFERI